MEFTNEFTVPLSVDEALDVLTDLERVAPCMPGATLQSVEGTTYSGKVKVKVGPMALTYAGTATVAERDDVAKTARIEAAGRENRGSGTANADVQATLVEKDGATVVTVTTDLKITGKPAQFGRGVMADVGAKIIDRFAETLREQLEEEQVASVAAAAVAATDAAADETAAGPSGPRLVEQRAPRDEALDLLDVAGESPIARAVPVVVAAVLVLIVLLVRRRRRA